MHRATIRRGPIKFEVRALTSRTRRLNVWPADATTLTERVDLLLVHPNIRVALRL